MVRRQPDYWHWRCSRCGLRGASLPGAMEGPDEDTLWAEGARSDPRLRGMVCDEVVALRVHLS